MNMDILSAIRLELKQNMDEKTRNNNRRFFKEDVTCYGVRVPTVNKIGKVRYREIASLGKQRIFMLCEELLKSDYCEEAYIAADWVYRLRNEYLPDDFPVFESWLHKYINNWAKCDTLCNHAVGSFIEKYPQYIKYLKVWTASENRWVRRAAAVTLIVPVKQGKFLDDALEISRRLLTDPEDLVQKGYGWLLKDASIKHQAEIFDFVMKNRSIMPRTALRYAIERMPQELRHQAMQ